MTATEPRVAEPAMDSRIADFKVLLPITPGCRVLVLFDQAPPPWAELLRQEGARVELHQQHSSDAPARTDYEVIVSTSAASLDPRAAALWWPALRKARSWLHIRTGGVGSKSPPSRLDGWRAVARWHAIPDWPQFRNLISEGQRVARGAARELMLLRAEGDTLERTLARLRPQATLRSTAAAQLELHVRDEPDSPRETAIAPQLCAAASEATAEQLSLERSVLLSGRLGEGNPILLFLFDRSGHPRWLWKIGRFAKQTHLTEERDQINELVAAMGPSVAERVIVPLTHLTVHEHEALLYRYEPCHPFYGLRWRLQARRNYCLALASWLSELAEATRRLQVSDTQHRSLECLQRLIDRRALPSDLHDDARHARDRFGSLLPLYGALEHGDLGMYNTRLSRADGSDFKVIDWGSSALGGLAFADLSYALSTLNAPTALARQCLRLYADRAGLEVERGYDCWLAYMARRWVELDRVAPDSDGVNLGGGRRLIEPTRRIRHFFAAASGGDGP